MNHNIVYRIVSGESRSADSETVQEWKNSHTLQETEGYMTSVIYIMLMRPVYFSIYNLAKSPLLDEIFAMVI
jgi:hypothetical protein